MELSRFVRDRGWGEHEKAAWNLESDIWSDVVTSMSKELQSADDRDALVDFITGVMMRRQSVVAESAVAWLITD